MSSAEKVCVVARFAMALACLFARAIFRPDRSANVLIGCDTCNGVPTLAVWAVIVGPCCCRRPQGHRCVTAAKETLAVVVCGQRGLFAHRLTSFRMADG